MGYFRQYAVQLFGFIMKTYLQRWRVPITTLFEILLPCLFTVLMAIAYWTCETTTIPAAVYDGGNNVIMNMSNFAGYYFCTVPGSSLKTSYPTCDYSATSPYAFKCLALVGNGQELCLPYTKYGTLSGLLYSMYYGSGPYAVNTMDAHLALSAMVTENKKNINPTFFGRGGQSSLAHYGELLVSSDDAEVGQRFMDYCTTEGGLCGEVLNTNLFSSLEDAKNYAADNEDTVWAIVDIPKSSLTRQGTTEFTISMNFTATASTSKGGSKSLFTRGLGENAGGDGYILYWTSGFMTLQTFVEEFYMDYLLENAPVVGPATYASSGNTLGIDRYLSQYGSGVIPMPTEERYNNEFLTQWAYYMPLVAVMAVLFPTSRLVMLIVREKHNGIREAMLIMGLHPSCLFLGWYSASILMDLVSSLLAAMFLKVSFMNKVNYGILLLLYFTFSQQNTALCFLVSALFRNPKIASWCIAFVLFMFAIPVYSFPDGMTAVQRLLVCLVPCVGYGQSYNIMLDYTSFGWHFGWKEATDGEFNVAKAIGMMWASFCILMLLAFYLDRVGFGAVGRAAHPLFFLQPLFRLCGYHRSPMIAMSDSGRPRKPGQTNTAHGDVAEAEESGSRTYSSGPSSPGLKKPKPSGYDANEPFMEGGRYVSEEDMKKALDPSRENRDMIEHFDDYVNPSDSTVAAVFHRLRKIYIGGGVLGYFYTYFTGRFREGDRVVALDGVTFAMRKGEVSVLLGPNGAGKSTIMGIATGMISPSSGTVYVSGYNADSNLDECRQNIGYCPQRDIVWDELTVEEHLRFYALLKGSENINVKEKARYVMDLVELTEKKKCKAGHLSGGQRRRLCVAIALVGDSSVLIMDEPTAGMDIRGRKIVYDALNKARDKRSVLISTHLLDEADRIADRVLMVNNGELCAEGSTMFLKSHMNVGYVVTCVLEAGMTAEDELAATAKLIDFVRDEGDDSRHTHRTDELAAMPKECKMLGVTRRGREVSFRFPLSLLSSMGAQLITTIQSNKEELQLRSVNLNLTTLEDVFFKVTQRTAASGLGTEAMVIEGEVEVGAEQSGESSSEVRQAHGDDIYETSTNWCVVFCRHFRALFLKRVHYAQRDIKLFFFQVFLPIFFLIMTLFINLVRPPSQPSVRMDMTLYDDYATNPSEVLTGYSEFSGSVAGIPVFVFRGNVQNAFQLSDSLSNYAWGSSYITRYQEFEAGLPNITLPLSQILMDELMTHERPRYIAISPVSTVFQAGLPTNGPILMHNASASHAAPQALSALYHLAQYQLFGASATFPTAVNSPMKLGEFEHSLVDANKQIMIGIFVILPFIFIPSNTIGYIVEEAECGARHLQWLSGASVLAYWLSSFVFDTACFIITEILAFIVFLIFDRQEYISKDMLAPSIVLFLFFGVSSIPVSYFLSFFFHSSFTAQSVVFCVNFTLGFLWVTVESMVAAYSLTFTKVVTYIARVLPAVCFGEGMYVISGNTLATLMFPTRTKTSMFALLSFTDEGDFVGGIGTGMIYMSCVMVGCTIGLVIMEYLRLQRVSSALTDCCTKKNAEDRAAYEELVKADPSVEVEEQRVCAEETGPELDSIAVQHLHKRYMGAKHAAVEDVSLGVHEGEVMGLLGLNGAGKTTILSILAGEVVATSGDAFVNHYSVLSASSRSYIGYCPQYDALLCNMSPTEHLYLYSRLRGVKEKHIHVEVPLLLKELGLYPYRNNAAGTLSGGNKRRLSLAIALVGHTKSVLLDEPTSGMDALARAQTCEMVRRLTAGKSIVLTTHLLDEVEALADRVAFVVRGNLRCVGTATELRTKYNSSAAYTVSVLFPHTVSLQGEESEVVEKVREYVHKKVEGSDAAVAQKKTKDDGEEDANQEEEEEAVCKVTEVHPCSMQMSVHGDLSVICSIVTELQEGKVEDIPQTAYVSVSQPTLEDILLLQ